MSSHDAGRSASPSAVTESAPAPQEAASLPPSTPSSPPAPSPPSAVEPTAPTKDSTTRSSSTSSPQSPAKSPADDAEPAAHVSPTAAASRAGSPAVEQEELAEAPHSADTSSPRSAPPARSPSPQATTSPARKRSRADDEDDDDNEDSVQPDLKKQALEESVNANLAASEDAALFDTPADELQGHTANDEEEKEAKDGSADVPSPQTTDVGESAAKPEEQKGDGAIEPTSVYKDAATQTEAAVEADKRDLEEEIRARVEEEIKARYSMKEAALEKKIKELEEARDAQEKKAADEKAELETQAADICNEMVATERRAAEARAAAWKAQAEEAWELKEATLMANITREADARHAFVMEKEKERHAQDLESLRNQANDAIVGMQAQADLANDAAHKEEERLREEITGLQEKNASLLESCEKWRGLVEQLSQEAEHLTETIDRLQGERDKQREAKAELEQKLANSQFESTWSKSALLVAEIRRECSDLQAAKVNDELELAKSDAFALRGQLKRKDMKSDKLWAQDIVKSSGPRHAAAGLSLPKNAKVGDRKAGQRHAKATKASSGSGFKRTAKKASKLPLVDDVDADTSEEGSDSEGEGTSDMEPEETSAPSIGDNDMAAALADVELVANSANADMQPDPSV